MNYPPNCIKCATQNMSIVQIHEISDQKACILPPPYGLQAPSFDCSVTKAATMLNRGRRLHPRWSLLVYLLKDTIMSSCHLPSRASNDAAVTSGALSCRSGYHGFPW